MEVKSGLLSVQLQISSPCCSLRVCSLSQTSSFLAANTAALSWYPEPAHITYYVSTFTHSAFILNLVCTVCIACMLHTLCPARVMHQRTVPASCLWGGGELMLPLPRAIGHLQLEVEEEIREICICQCRERRNWPNLSNNCNPWWKEAAGAQSLQCLLLRNSPLLKGGMGTKRRTGEELQHTWLRHVVFMHGLQFNMQGIIRAWTISNHSRSWKHHLMYARLVA